MFVGMYEIYIGDEKAFACPPAFAECYNAGDHYDIFLSTDGYINGGFSLVYYFDDVPLFEEPAYVLIESCIVPEDKKLKVPALKDKSLHGDCYLLGYINSIELVTTHTFDDLYDPDIHEDPTIGENKIIEQLF